MELKTDGGIYLTREEYRKTVKKVMNRQAKEAFAAALMTSAEKDINPDTVADILNQALGLQMQALANMERALFGKPEKKDEGATKE